MRPAALRLVRSRYCPMHSSLDSFSPIKRSHSQQAAARIQQQPPTPPLSDFPPTKRQRAEDGSSPAFLSTRRRSLPGPSSVVPPNSMALRGRGTSRRPGGTPPTLDAVDRPSSSSHRHQAKQKRRGPDSAPPKSVLTGPLHDQDTIIKEHFKSVVDLKTHDKQTPKSPLHNFYAIVKDGRQPRYESTRGSVIMGDKYVEVWRYVRSRLCLSAVQ